MTKTEAAIVSAYTGFLIGDFNEMHKYAEKLMGRPIFTDEFGSKDFCQELREKSFNDYVNITIGDNNDQ